MEERDYFAWISTVKDIQYTKLNRLLKGVNGIEELYHSSEKKITKYDRYYKERC